MQSIIHLIWHSYYTYRQQPYHVENTGSRLLTEVTEVKQHWAVVKLTTIQVTKLLF
jgi:hypothetical protein